MATAEHPFLLVYATDRARRQARRLSIDRLEDRVAEAMREGRIRKTFPSDFPPQSRAQDLRCVLLTRKTLAVVVKDKGRISDSRAWTVVALSQKERD